MSHVLTNILECVSFMAANFHIIFFVHVNAIGIRTFCGRLLCEIVWNSSFQDKYVPEMWLYLSCCADDRCYLFTLVVCVVDQWDIFRVKVENFLVNCIYARHTVPDYPVGWRGWQPRNHSKRHCKGKISSPTKELDFRLKSIYREIQTWLH